jgi:SH3-like domain-containing protein
MRLALTIALATALAAPSAFAQVEVTSTADARARPGGPVVASVTPGTSVVAGASSGSEMQITFEGWVDASRLGAKRDSFPASVSGRVTLRLRASPANNGKVLAVLQPGTGLHLISRQGAWARVRRTAWVPASTVRGATDSSNPSPSVSKAPASVAPAPALSPAPVSSSVPASQGQAARAANGFVGSNGTRFHDLPVGRTLGGITAGSAVEIVARQSGWVRIRADGWVPERDIVARDSTAAPDVTAADLRADPKGMRGRIVQWEVEIMSLQIADPLRVDLVRDEPYLLARGPGNENAILYLAVPQSLLPEARGLAPLTRVHVTARVRAARSEPAGTPVLDILSIGKR